MPDRKTSGLPYEAATDEERQLFEALSELPAAEPSPELRQRFLARLQSESRPTPLQRVQDFLGFSGAPAWISACACLLLGIGSGLWLAQAGTASDRLVALEQNVALLNRSLILDRVNSPAPDKRLQGIMDAAYFVADDAEIAQALLTRATTDRVASVRSAAIGALGPAIATPDFGSRLMALLDETESPLVQLALVDLVLRYGTTAQRQQLLQLADTGGLNSELAGHVRRSLGSDTV